MIHILWWNGIAIIVQKIVAIHVEDRISQKYHTNTTLIPQTMQYVKWLSHA